MKKKIKEKNIMKYVVLVAILLIPFMYSFFYLKAFWNPYGQMNEIPVAIVNLDQTVDGVNKGQELVDMMIGKDVLKLTTVSQEEATDGLQKKDYYAVITIPSNFTSNLTSASSEDKQLTTITYTPNQKTNYLASQIISKVIDKVEAELRSNVSSTVVKTLTDKLNEVPKQVETMKTGMEQLSGGISSVNKGTSTILDGLKKLNTNYSQFDAGVQKSKEGSNSLVTSLTDLTGGLTKLETGISEFGKQTSALPELVSGIDALATNHSKLTTSLDAYTTGVSAVNSAYNQLVTSICSVDATSSDCLTAMAIQKNLNGLSTSGTELNASNKKINGSLNYVNQKTTALSNVQNAVATIQKNVTTLKDGSAKITKGATDLQSGLSTLASSSSEIKTGIGSLTEGSTELNLGTTTLYTKTQEAITSIDANLTTSKAELKKLDGLDSFVKNSVTIEEQDQNKISEYGVAFAPYFISLSLWVGALMLFIVLFYDVKDRFKLFSRNNKNKVQRTMGYMGMATLQAIGLGLLLKLGLGFEVTNVFLYFGSLILIANTFLLIMEFLIVNFNDVGKFLGILFLVFQLAASGGTFPIETVPKFFQSIYNFMPMKYSINLIKESIVTNEASIAGSNAMVLIGIAIVTFVLIVIADVLKKKKNK